VEYKRFRKDIFEQLSQVNFDNLLASDDIDSITRSNVKILINEADKAIPNRIITVRKDNPPWLTTEIKRYTLLLNELFNLHG
jgi:hypothetical protein